MSFDREEEDELSSNPLASPGALPIRRRRSYERLLSDEMEDRRRAPQTFYQTTNREEPNLESFNSVESTTSFSQFSSQSYINLNKLFEPVFRNEKNDQSTFKSRKKHEQNNNTTFLERYLIQPIKLRFLYFIQRIQDIVYNIVQFSLILSGGGILVTFLFWFGLLLSIIVYWFVWWHMFPQMSHTIPIFFDFDPHSNGQQAYFCKTSDILPRLELPEAHINLLLAPYQWELHQTALTALNDEKTKSLKRPKFHKFQRTKKGVKKKPQISKKVLKRKKSTNDISYQERVTDKIVDWRYEKYGSEKETKVLSSGEKYDISLELRVRNNQKNHDLGPFMILTELITPREKVIASSKRPAIIEELHETTSFLDWEVFSIINLLLKVIFFPIYLVFVLINFIVTQISLIFFTNDSTAFYANGIQKQSILMENEINVELIALEVLLFEQFQEQAPFFLSVASINITLSQPCLEIWDSRLHFEVKLNGYRYFVYHYKWLCFLVYFITVVVVEVNNLVILSTLVSIQLWLNGFT